MIAGRPGAIAVNHRHRQVGYVLNDGDDGWTAVAYLYSGGRRKTIGHPTEEDARRRIFELRTSGCVLWDGSRDKSGYGRWKYRGKKETAHRVSYAQAQGLELADIKGQSILHSCHQRLCVNPAHLRLGTHQDNMADLKKKNRETK